MSTFAVSSNVSSGYAPLIALIEYTYLDCNWKALNLLSISIDFGDGSVVNEAIPATDSAAFQHVYTRAGTYTPKITACNSLGTTATVTGSSITVSGTEGLTSTLMCLRFATEPAEGYGWSERSGDQMVVPYGSYGAINVIDANDQQRCMVLDETDKVFYECDTYDPVNHTKPSFTDKEGAEVESEISGEIWYPEETAEPTNPNQRIKLEGTHFGIRPQDPVNRGKAGYTSTGLRSAQSFSMDAYIDGEKTTPAGTASDFTETADIDFPGISIEGRRIQPVFKFEASEFRISCRQHDILTKEVRGSVSDRTMGEVALQNEAFSDKLFELSRSVPGYDRIGKSRVFASSTSVDGPDGLTGSAINISAGKLYSSSIPGNYTILLWQYGANTVPAYYTNSTPPYFHQLSFTAYAPTSPTTWNLFVRKSSDLILPATGLLLVAGKYFAIRIYSKTLSDSCIAAIYNDVINNAGRGYYPL